MREWPKLTEEIIQEALRAGKIQGRGGSFHGHCYIKLIRSEVEQLVKEKFGESYIKMEEQRTRVLTLRSQLKSIPNEIDKAKEELKRLEERREWLEKEEKELVEELGENAPPLPRGRGRGGKTAAGVTKKKKPAVKRKAINDDKDYKPSASGRGRGRGRGGRGGTSKRREEVVEMPALSDGSEETKI